MVESPGRAQHHGVIGVPGTIPISKKSSFEFLPLPLAAEESPLDVAPLAGHANSDKSRRRPVSRGVGAAVLQTHRQPLQRLGHRRRS